MEECFLGEGCERPVEAWRRRAGLLLTPRAPSVAPLYPEASHWPAPPGGGKTKSVCDEDRGSCSSLNTLSKNTKTYQTFSIFTIQLPFVIIKVWRIECTRPHLKLLELIIVQLHCTIIE